MVFPDGAVVHWKCREKYRIKDTDEMWQDHERRLASALTSGGQGMTSPFYNERGDNPYGDDGGDSNPFGDDDGYEDEGTTNPFAATESSNPFSSAPSTNPFGAADQANQSSNPFSTAQPANPFQTSSNPFG